MANEVNDFVGAVKDGLNRYGDFSGVSSRPQYWFFFLANAIASAAAFTVAGNSGQNLLSLITFIPSLAVAVRRMHDVGKSGWFVLIPIYNIILLATPSKPVVH